MVFDRGAKTGSLAGCKVDGQTIFNIYSGPIRTARYLMFVFGLFAANGPKLTKDL